MAVISPTTSAQHVDLRMAAAQRAVFLAELHRIAGIEIRRLIELLMAAFRGIGPDAAHPLHPAFAIAFRGSQHLAEMGRVRAVDHVIDRTAPGRGVDLTDRMAEALTGRQAAVRLEREGEGA